MFPMLLFYCSRLIAFCIQCCKFISNLYKVLPFLRICKIFISFRYFFSTLYLISCITNFVWFFFFLHVTIVINYLVKQLQTLFFIISYTILLLCFRKTKWWTLKLIYHKVKITSEKSVLQFNSLHSKSKEKVIILDNFPLYYHRV